MKKNQKKTNTKIQVNKYFVFIVVSEILILYLMSISLLYTFSTNLILINNFSPVFALVLALIFWSSQTPYLKQRKHVFLIFLIFITGCAGSGLVLYNDIKHSASDSLWGDALAFSVMAVDVVLVVSQIRYVRTVKKMNTLWFTLVVFVLGAILTLPIVFLYFNAFLQFTGKHFAYALLTGTLIGVGEMLNYEAFKRIDGFIAFLMFNISIFITFVGEAFILHKIVPTFLLIVGGSLIMGSSVAAEFINSKSEKINSKNEN